MSVPGDAVVTRGASGIGLALAHALGARGALSMLFWPSWPSGMLGCETENQVFGF